MSRFDETGTLRAEVAAESAQALDLLRRDSADLSRALADAGVRADAGSFRFDQRSGGGDTSRAFRPDPRRAWGDDEPDAPAAAPYRTLRTAGRVDLVA